MRNSENNTGMLTRWMFASIVFLSIPNLGVGQDAGPWSVIYEGMGWTESGGGDNGSSSSTGTEDDEASFGDNVTDTPVDGGLSLLLAAGAAYGARRLRRRRD
jgi:hypothetical protein